MTTTGSFLNDHYPKQLVQAIMESSAESFLSRNCVVHCDVGFIELKNISYYNHKYVGVLGLGLSGNAAARVLVNSKAIVFVFDDKKSKSLVPKKTTWLNYKDWNWGKIDTLFVSPGIPINSKKTHPAIKIAKKNNLKKINQDRKIKKNI